MELKKTIDSATLEAARCLIDGHQRFVITTHISPDGDALGSAIGLHRWLKKKGKDVTVIFNDAPGMNLSFIPGHEEGIIYETQDKSLPSQKEAALKTLHAAEVLIASDYNELSRTGEMATELKKLPIAKMMVDHHLNPATGEFDVIISHPEMAAACEVVYHLICELGDADLIDETIAGPLFCGLMTDTGMFSYTVNDPSPWLVAGDLVARGADAERFRRDCELETERRARLMGYVLDQKMTLIPEHKAAFFSLTKPELKKYGYQKGDSEGFVNLPLNLYGIRVSAYFREEKNFVKVSLRSKGDYPVNEICSRFFGGGGHKNAAGGEFHGSLEMAEKLFLKALPLYDRFL